MKLSDVSFVLGDESLLRKSAAAFFPLFRPTISNHDDGGKRESLVFIAAIRRER